MLYFLHIAVYFNIDYFTLVDTFHDTYSWLSDVMVKIQVTDIKNMWNMYMCCVYCNSLTFK